MPQQQQGWSWRHVHTDPQLSFVLGTTWWISSRSLPTVVRHLASGFDETAGLSPCNLGAGSSATTFRVNDPVALKLGGKAGEMPSLQPPDDETIRTLNIGGLDNRVAEQDLRGQFYAHGEIESIRMVLQRACAFVTYTTREGAERAAEELANKLVIKGVRLKLKWCKPQAPRPDNDEAGRQGHVSHGRLFLRAVISQQHSSDHPQPSGMEGHSKWHQDQATSTFPLPAVDQWMYPSMDPQIMDAVVLIAYMNPEQSVPCLGCLAATNISRFVGLGVACKQRRSSRRYSARPGGYHHGLRRRWLRSLILDTLNGHVVVCQAEGAQHLALCTWCDGLVTRQCLLGYH